MANIAIGDGMENKLRELRGHRSLDQISVEFKKRGYSTVSKSRISKWERGEEKPSLANALVLFDIYNITDPETISRIKITFGLE